MDFLSQYDRLPENKGLTIKIGFEFEPLQVIISVIFLAIVLAGMITVNRHMANVNEAMLRQQEVIMRQNDKLLHDTAQRR